MWSRDNHEDDTWTARTPGGELHWVREALQPDPITSRARVLVHAYNASEVFESAQTGVAVQAEGLLNRLLLVRKVSHPVHAPRNDLLNCRRVWRHGLSSSLHTVLGGSSSRRYVALMLDIHGPIYEEVLTIPLPPSF